MDSDSGDLESGHGDADEGGHQEQPSSPDAPAAGVDIGKLTAKVYRLMLDELRLEQARGVARKNR